MIINACIYKLGNDGRVDPNCPRYVRMKNEELQFMENTPKGCGMPFSKLPPCPANSIQDAMNEGAHYVLSARITIN